MSSANFATSAILSLALGIWFLMVGRDPKKWRLWWLDIFGILDVDTNRALRRMQENTLKFFAFLLFALFIAMSVSCSFWSIDQWKDQQRPRTSLEREMEYHRQKVLGEGR
jgi:hypothetical protein